ncbi:aromatic ring-hydroxylating dioxygenase subunit alpha [Pseudomonas sp. ZM23]|uniref:Aromatic ring-hydroxylating dioxygenase subunit alpha n=1 Tax=Pseudomonas triclosanedens TaxID=2961893 RepID=A0ABY7A7U7_9PSED|nr:aromatic ring-hydroxylating dioxygenase subunit alpha [Pseudomonas triclosanedens]MCP8466412.1 aromatic ring-hydroxylating dioxygenase subunit alpha [Pseudomonas triclosanedens]MCP8473186.1 aromatic ring-hydroxylating dioxygenase subunit alpha [Pseudomonas triclosanedens]MCP8479064.1 aromatic ring-hydroxylating dioxygenase subunit alpha [Pseudomonas triclosanedens]WAI52173.1 aromatic ring-hydroxylating dioxygenase subunit alpha [Pseudomonas triclosanedens]
MSAHEYRLIARSRSVEELVGDDRVDVSLYNDPQLFDAEMDKIFYRTWVWVAHESEVRNPGDFKTTSVGRRPVIVVRDKKGNINVLENRCRHRGATVCEKHKGNATGFTCPYHSWSYALDGKLRALPYPDGYEDILDKSELPLTSLRVESYAGMVFATYNDEIEPLEDFLGGAKHWMDLFMKQGAGYPIKTQGEHKFTFKGNWKIQLENTTDGYHFPIVHKSFMSSVDEETEEMLSFMSDEQAVTHALGNGHSVMVMVPEHVDLDHDDGTEQLQERFAHVTAELSKTMQPAQVRRIVRSLHGAGFNLNLFPNVAMSMSFFRVLRPISVTETEIRHVALGMDGGPEIANRERMRIHEHFQGPFGFGSPDDAEAWDRVQRGSYAGVDAPILVNRGLNREVVAQNGDKVSHATDEGGMREAYRMWKRMMSQ